MTDLFAALLIIFVTTCDLDCCLYNQNKKKTERDLSWNHSITLFLIPLYYNDLF